MARGSRAHQPRYGRWSPRQTEPGRLLLSNRHHARAPRSIDRGARDLKEVTTLELLGHSGSCVIARAVPVDDDDRLVTHDPRIVPGGQGHDITGNAVEFGPVCHQHVDGAGHLVLEVWCLTPSRPGERLDVLGPAPAGLKRQAPYLPAADVDQIDRALRERSALI